MTTSRSTSARKPAARRPAARKAPAKGRAGAASTAKLRSELEDLRQNVQQVWLAGLGALADLGDQGEKLVGRLVDRGESLEEKGKDGLEYLTRRAAEARDLASHTLGRIEEMVDDRVASVLDRVGVPTREEIRGLTRRVSELTAKVEKLRPARRAR